MTDGEFGVGGWYLRDNGWIGVGTGPVLRGLSSGWMARVTADGVYTDADACGGGRPCLVLSLSEGEESLESKDTSWEVKADVPEDKELSQYGMILLLMGPPVSSFGFSMDVIESKNSAAVILDIASLLMAMSESKGDFELVAGLGETLNWRESASCGQSNRATRAPPWPRGLGTTGDSGTLPLQIRSRSQAE